MYAEFGAFASYVSWRLLLKPADLVAGTKNIFPSRIMRATGFGRGYNNYGDSNDLNYTGVPVYPPAVPPKLPRLEIALAPLTSSGLADSGISVSKDCSRTPETTHEIQNNGVPHTHFRPDR